MEILMEGSKSFGMNCYSPRQPKQNSLQNALRQNKRQHLCESGQASTYFKFRYTYIYLHFKSRKVHLLIVLVVDVRKGSLLWTSLNLRSFILSCIYMYCIIYMYTSYILCNWVHVIIYHINVLHHLAHLVPSSRHQGIYNIHRVVTRPFQYKPGIFYIWNELIQRWKMSLTLGKGQNKIIKTKFFWRS